MPTLATATYIINTACQELGLPPVSLNSADGDATGYQSLGMLNALGDELVKVKDWQFLMKEMGFVGDGVTESFPMPADFGRQVNQTEWNASAQRPMIGPVSPQVWAWQQFGIVAAGFFFRYRINHNKYQVFPIPGAGQTFAMYYISKNWVIDGTSPDPDDPLYLDTIIHASDIPLFDRRLLIAGLKVKLWAQKGFETTTLAEEFKYLLDAEKAQNQGAAVISLSNGGNGYLLNYNNVSDGNYGY